MLETAVPFPKPPLQWLKDRARGILRVHGARITRRMAIWDAWFSWIIFNQPKRIPAKKALAIVEATYG